MSRPPLPSSPVAAILASIAGAWKAVAATSGPSRIREVLAAMAESRVQTSHGPRGGPSSYRYRRWSPSHRVSKPTSSAAFAIATYSGQRTTRSTSGSWMPMRRDRPLDAMPASLAANGRGGRIRTDGLMLPKHVRYQAALRPDGGANHRAWGLRIREPHAGERRLSADAGRKLAG